MKKEKVARVHEEDDWSKAQGNYKEIKTWLTEIKRMLYRDIRDAKLEIEVRYRKVHLETATRRKM